MTLNEVLTYILYAEVQDFFFLYGKNQKSMFLRQKKRRLEDA